MAPALASILAISQSHLVQALQPVEDLAAEQCGLGALALGVVAVGNERQDVDLDGAHPPGEVGICRVAWIVIGHFMRMEVMRAPGRICLPACSAPSMSGATTSKRSVTSISQCSFASIMRSTGSGVAAMIWSSLALVLPRR